MIESLRRHQAKQAQTTPTPAAVVVLAQSGKNPAPEAPPAARSWSAPDPGAFKTYSPAPAAPAPKQSGLDKRMVALLAQQAKPTSR